MENSEELVKNLESSIRRATQSLLEVSHNTIMHIPELGKVEMIASLNGMEDTLLASFRRNIDQIFRNGLRNISDEEKRSIVLQDMSERSHFLKRELEKMAVERTNLETNILNLSKNINDISASIQSNNCR